MSSVKLTQVKINAVDVSEYVYNYEVIETFGNSIYSAKISLTPSVLDVVTLANSQSVEIWDGYTTSTDTKIFSGFLETFSPEPGKIIVTAFNKMYAAVRTALTAVTYDSSVVANPVYPSGKYSDAFYDLVTTYAGLSATNGTTITDSGTAHVISKLLCYKTSVKERLDAIATALDWIYYYKASDDKVYFQPKQTTANSLVLEVGVNVINVPKWKYDKTDLINDLRVDGAYQDSFVTQTFNGDGALQSFTLTYTPVGDVALYYSAAKNYQTTAKTEQEKKTLGVTNVTTGSYDFTVDKSTKKISTVGANGGGFTPAAGTNNLLAEYVASIPVPVHFQDDVSIATYLLHQRQINLTDVITVADAESRAQMVIDKFKNPFESTTLQVAHDSANSYNVGDSIRVIDDVSTPAVDQFYTIFSINRRWPGGYDELMVGDREFDPPEFFINLAAKITALEQEIYNTDGVLVEIRTNEMELPLEPDTMVVDEYYVNDSFILDDAGTHPNSILYDSTETTTLSDFESAADWAQGSGSVTLTETNDSTSGHFWVGTQGLNYSWAVGTGTGVIDNTTAAQDLKEEVNSQCLDFDGTSDYVLIPHNSAYNFTTGSNFTVNFWVSPDTPSSANRRPVSKESTGTLQGWRFLHNENTGSIVMSVGNGTTSQNTPTGTISGSSGWHMVTGVWDTTTGFLRLYVDGSQVSTGTAITLTGTLTNSINVAFGTNASSPGGATDYDGRIANVAFWSRALGASEISTLYTTPNSVSSTNLVGWWKLNDNSTTTSVDSSSTANNGAITAATVSNTWFYPWRGTAGVWVYTPQSADISAMTLRLGSSSTDYLEVTGKQYAWQVAGVESSFALDDALLTYVVFDLDAGTWATKAIDWTGVDFRQIRWTIAGAGDATFDYLTVSKSNTIGLNGLGDRMTLKGTVTYTY